MKGEAAIILAAILMSTVSIFVREIEGDALSVTFLRFSSASAILLTFVFLERIRKMGFGSKKGRKRRVRGLIALAILNTLTVCCYIYSIQRLEVATAVLLLYMAPIYVLMISFLIGEKIERRNILATTFGLLGLYLILSPYPAIDFIAVLSGLFYALVFITMKRVREFYEPLEISTFNVSFGSILLLPFFLKNPASASVFEILALGLIPTAIPFTLFAYGIKYVRVQRAPIISLVEPISAVLIGFLYFNEVLSLIQLVGISLVLLSIFITSS